MHLLSSSTSHAPYSSITEDDAPSSHVPSEADPEIPVVPQHNVGGGIIILVLHLISNVYFKCTMLCCSNPIGIIKRCRVCSWCLIGIPALFLVACVAFLIFIGVRMVDVNSTQPKIDSGINDSISISDVISDQHKWFAREVCISQNQCIDGQLTVTLNKCKGEQREMRVRSIKNHFNNNITNASLKFHWLYGTSVSFQVNTTADKIDGYITINITTDNQDECNLQLFFYFNGNINVSTANCPVVEIDNSSSEVVIRKTQRYNVYISSNTSPSHTYDVEAQVTLIANERIYDTQSCDSTDCSDQQNCCVSYDDLFQEIFNPTFIILQTSADNDNHGYDLLYHFNITSQKKWDAVICVAVFGVTFVPFLIVSVSCEICSRLYRKRNPNQHCVKLKVCGYTLLYL